jgi:uncharacterized protein
LSIVVSDTSPIRALAHLGHLELLEALFGEVLIPPTVVRELEQPRLRFKPVVVSGLRFVRVQCPTNQAMVDELMLSLGPGEAEAVALALEVRAEAILIDETAGRVAARQRGLLPLGDLGTLVRAKQRHLVQEVKPLLDRLQSELGFFISPSLRTEILRQAGE